MPITDKLHQARSEFVLRSGGASPGAIFLGHDEHDALMTIAEQFAGGVKTTSPIDDEPARLEWKCMKVYRVDARTFVGFQPCT